MRILHVLNHSRRQNGNVHAAVDLACAQAALGHAVALCSGGGEFDAVLKANGVAVELLPELARPKALPAADKLPRRSTARNDRYRSHPGSRMAIHLFISDLKFTAIFFNSGVCNTVPNAIQTEVQK